MSRWRKYAALAASIVAIAVLLAGCGLPGTIASGGTLPQARPAPTATPLPPVRFPQDEAPHHDLTEWWYYTGHLYASDHAHTYGFELTFFQTLRGGLSPYYAAHFAVSDITRGQFHYDQRAAFESASVIPPSGSTQGFHLALDGWSASGLNGSDHLRAAMAGYSIDLALKAETPPVLHGGNGLISYGDAGFSYYYSRPLMAVTGSVVDHGVSVPVTGQAWMDHQWGNFLTLAGTGWDWYSIQLDNRTEYMLYVIRGAQNQPVSAFGTAVAADGSASEIPASAIHIRVLGTWTSPVTGGVYPSGWAITVASQHLSLTLTPQLKDQELVTTSSTGVAYWEGAVSIDGTAGGKGLRGVGYVELTGYATTSSAGLGATAP